MKRIKMQAIQFTKDFEIEILLSTGERIFYDLRFKRKTARFGDIANWEDFSTGILMNGTLIRWNYGVELSLDEILGEKDGWL